MIHEMEAFKRQVELDLVAELSALLHVAYGPISELALNEAQEAWLEAQSERVAVIHV